MSLKWTTLVTLILWATSPVAALEVADLTQHGGLKKLPSPTSSDTVYFSSSPKLEKFKEWYDRPYASVLIPVEFKRDTTHPILTKLDRKMFEARGSFILPVDIKEFTAARLHTLATVKALDPKNDHKDISQNVVSQKPKSPVRLLPDGTPEDPPFDFDVNPSPGTFAVRTVVPFTDSFKTAMELAQKFKSLSTEKLPFIEMVSTFRFYGQQDIQQMPALQSLYRSFGISDRLPDAINVQGIFPINQIGIFGSAVSFFYSLGPSKTQVFVIYVLAIKRRVCERDYFGGYTGEMILMRQLPEGGIAVGPEAAQVVINPYSSTGLASGLPNFSKEMIVNMADGLQKLF